MHNRFAVLIVFSAILAWSPASADRLQGYAEHTPGNSFLAQGIRSYHAGRYFDARHRFQRAAYWADKFAQFNLGVMYYNGEGVDPDPRKSWAWFELASERGYPKLVEMAALVWSELDEQQRLEARKILENDLAPRYGDAVAIERTAHRMERERRQVTGSRVGFVGNLQVNDGSFGWRDGNEFFDERRWDFNRIVELETRMFQAVDLGRVTVGDTEVVEDENDE